MSTEPTAGGRSVRPPGSAEAATVDASAVTGADDDRGLLAARFREGLGPLLAAIPNAVLVVLRDGRVVGANAEFGELFGLPADEVVGTSIERFVPAGHRVLHRRLRAGYAKAPADRPMGTGRHVRALRADGSEFTAEISLRAVELLGRACVVATVVDISDRVAAIDRLVEEAQLDPLTHLPNRAALDDRVVAAGLGRRRDDRVAVLFMDVDGFKAVNDRHGHQVGDAVLAVIAGRLRSALRPLDFLARYGGDEFVAILARIDQAAAAGAIGRRVVREMLVPIPSPVGELSSSISVGVALGRDRQIPELIERADAAMRRAKRSDLGLAFAGASDRPQGASTRRW